MSIFVQPNKLRVRKNTTLSGPVPPQNGTSSGCGWRRPSSMR